MLSVAIGGPVLALSFRETAARNRFVGLHFMGRYQTHVFRKDRAMTVEEEINDIEGILMSVIKQAVPSRLRDARRLPTDGKAATV
jgi:hypothetical protein